MEIGRLKVDISSIFIAKVQYYGVDQAVSPIEVA